MFWDRFYLLCETKFGKKPNALLNELGVASGTLSRWKNKGKLPDGEKLLDLSRIFEVSVDYLLTGRENNDTLSVIETEMLSVFRKLPTNEQYKLIGRAELIAEQAEANSKADVS